LAQQYIPLKAEDRRQLGVILGDAKTDNDFLTQVSHSNSRIRN